MLKIHFGSLNNEVYVADPYFDTYFKKEWLEDEFNKKMILDVDKSKVVAPNVIESPILGTIPPQWLSGGVKALICMNSDKNGFIFNGTNCGDNCAKWILKIAENKDLTITLHHFLDLWYEDIEPITQIYIINTDKFVNTLDEYMLEFSRYQQSILEPEKGDI